MCRAGKVNTRFPTTTVHVSRHGAGRNAGGELKNDEIPLSLRVSTVLFRVHTCACVRVTPCKQQRGRAHAAAVQWFLPLFVFRSDFYFLATVILRWHTDRARVYELYPKSCTYGSRETKTRACPRKSQPLGKLGSSRKNTNFSQILIFNAHEPFVRTVLCKRVVLHL